MNQNNKNSKKVRIKDEPIIHEYEAEEDDVEQYFEDDSSKDKDQNSEVTQWLPIKGFSVHVIMQI